MAGIEPDNLEPPEVRDIGR